MGIHVGQGVNLPSLGVPAARFANAVKYEPHVYAGVSDSVVEHGHVGIAFVTGGMGNDELGARVFKAAHQLDGVLDAFALHHARRLKDEPIVIA